MQIFPCPKDTSNPPIVQPSIDIGSLTIDEPVMVLTDLLVAAVCFYAWFHLRKISGSSKTKTFVLIYFLSMGAATTIGGIIGHGFISYLNFYYKLPAWLTSMISIAMLERACIELAKPYIKSGVGRFFSWINMIELIFFAIISLYTLCFFYVEMHAAYGLVIVVFSFCLFLYFKTKHRGIMWYLIAVGFATISAIIFTFDLYINQWITHVDLGHIFMALSAYFFFLGSKAILTTLKKSPQL